MVHLGFAEQVEAARDGWLQGRYYSEEGDTVADFLSFRSVFEVNPFVVGVSYARERRVYAAWRKVVGDLLDVRELMGRAFTSLSNGEMRRVLFARALLKGPRRLVVEDPYGGLDPAHRAQMREVLEEVRRRGGAVTNFQFSTHLVLSDESGALLDRVDGSGKRSAKKDCAVPEAAADAVLSVDCFCTGTNDLVVPYFDGRPPRKK